MKLLAIIGATALIAAPAFAQDEMPSWEGHRDANQCIEDYMYSVASSGHAKNTHDYANALSEVSDVTFSDEMIKCQRMKADWDESTSGFYALAFQGVKQQIVDQMLADQPNDIDTSSQEAFAASMVK